jgi:hypothetical protein
VDEPQRTFPLIGDAVSMGQRGRHVGGDESRAGGRQVLAASRGPRQSPFQVHAVDVFHDVVSSFRRALLVRRE